MLKKVQMKLHRWLCVLAYFPVAIFDQLQALTTSDSYVSLATERLDGLRGVLVWEVLSRMRVTGKLLGRGFLCNLEQRA